MVERAAAAMGRRGDGRAAVAALLRAADLSPSGPERARRLAEAAYAGVSLTGDLRDVPRLLDQARRAAPEAGSLAMGVAGSAYLLYGSGDVDAVCGRLCGAIALRPEPYDPADATLSEALQALHTLLLACFFGGGPVLWSRFDAAVARYPAVPVLLATARSTFADPAHASPSDLPELDAAITGLADESDPLRIVRVALAGIYVDRLGGCAEGLRRVAAGGRRGENITPAICALFLLGIEAWQAGQWPELRQLAREGLDLCDEYRYPALAWLGKFLLACAAAACGDDAEALSLAGQMDQWAEPRRAYTVRAWAARAKALSALGRGDFDEAYQQAVLVAPTGTLPEFASHAVWMVLDLAEAAVRTGRCQQARDHVAAASGAGLGALSPRLRMLLHAASALRPAMTVIPVSVTPWLSRGPGGGLSTWPGSSCITESSSAAAAGGPARTGRAWNCGRAAVPRARLAGLWRA